MSYISRTVQALEAYTPGEQPNLTGVVKLNTNENPYPPSPAVGLALREFDWQGLRLYPDPVFKALRRRLAEIHGATPDQVFVGNGSDEVLALATRAFVENDGSIGYFNPSYSLYPVLADIRGVERRPVELAEDFSWAMPEGYRADLFFLTNPNAPTSLLHPKATVGAFASGFDGVVFIDEAYADFAPETCMSLAVDPRNRNTIVMRTLSKSFSLAGLRFGYCVGPAELIGALYKIKDSYNMDRLAQTLAFAALNDLDSMQSNVRKIIDTRRILTRELTALGWKVLPSATNFLFARPPDGRAEERFLRLKERRIFVRYFPAPRTREYLRITIGTDDEMHRLVEALKAIDSHPDSRA